MTVGVGVGGVSGAQPTLGGDRLGCGVGAVSVAGGVLGRAGPDLADVTDRIAIGLGDPAKVVAEGVVQG